MAERRRAARREPIEVEVEDGRVFIARPLPWTEASDFANEIMRQSVEVTNDLVRMFTTDAGVPQLEMKARQKLEDWHIPLKMAFPDVADEVWIKPRILDMEECAELLIAACDVNHLEHMKHLIDPNSPTPTLLGGNDSSAEGMEKVGEKIESTLTSLGPDSTANPPSPSPEVK